jgi:thioesterase domain-containing protein
MAARYLAAVREAQPRGPYRLLGWSFGGLVAFEMARRLRQEGEEVALLALLDTAVPVGGGLAPEAFGDDALWLADIAVFVERLTGKRLPVSYEELADLAPDEQVERLVASLWQADFLPPGAGAAQVRRLLAVYKANVRAGQAWRPRPYAGGLTLFRAREGFPIEGAEEARLGSAQREALELRRRDPALGWEAFAGEPVAVETVGGSHVTLLAEPHIRGLAERLAACLAAAEVRPEAVLVG